MNKTTKIIIWAIVLVIVVWGGVKLFGTKNEKTNEPIKIGAALSLTGKAANGVLYSYSFDPQSENQEIKVFVEKYKTKYNEVPTSYVAEGYDALDLIIKAVKECKEVDTACMKTKLTEIKNYPGILGSLTFDKNGDVYYPYFIKTVKDGEFVKYEE